jgi:hypothetical protein
MKPLATILLSAWLMWVHVYAPDKNLYEPKGTYSSLDACQADVVRTAEEHETLLRSWQSTTPVTGVRRFSEGGGEGVLADMGRGSGIYQWRWKCFPEHIDPRR